MDLTSSPNITASLQTTLGRFLEHLFKDENYKSVLLPYKDALESAVLPFLIERAVSNDDEDEDGIVQATSLSLVDFLFECRTTEIDLSNSNSTKLSPDEILEQVKMAHELETSLLNDTLQELTDKIQVCALQKSQQIEQIKQMTREKDALLLELQQQNQQMNNVTDEEETIRQLDTQVKELDTQIKETSSRTSQHEQYIQEVNKLIEEVENVIANKTTTRGKLRLEYHTRLKTLERYEMQLQQQENCINPFAD